MNPVPIQQRYSSRFFHHSRLKTKMKTTMTRGRVGKGGERRPRCRALIGRMRRHLTVVHVDQSIKANRHRTWAGAGTDRQGTCQPAACWRVQIYVCWRISVVCKNRRICSNCHCTLQKPFTAIFKSFLNNALPVKSHNLDLGLP